MQQPYQGEQHVCRMWLLCPCPAPETPLPTLTCLHWSVFFPLSWEGKGFILMTQVTAGQTLSPPLVSTTSQQLLRVPFVESVTSWKRRAAAVLVACRFLRPSTSQRRLKILLWVYFGWQFSVGTMHSVGEGWQSSSELAGAQRRKKPGLGRWLSHTIPRI